MVQPANAIGNFVAQRHEFRVIVKEQDFFIGDCSSIRARREHEKCKGFGDVFFGVGSRVIGDKTLFVGVIEIIQRFVVGIIIFDQVDILPFFVNVVPKLVEKSVDV